ncbi:UDP-N-acetylmuramoyl-tripeptide--D-alanyl-D-alanine ligase [Patescibacteria group bacterium]|nr:UDP-N-acetylmuramoyl-tripeptide--D-alanyl-D-alanine ligase [Patescibacteria group bacterium]
MKYLLVILWLLIFTKLFVFWVWLWQLKEYHWGRFKAHFETQLLRKLFFSVHGARYPKLTKKILAILFSGIVFEITFLFLIFGSRYYLLYLLLSLLIVMDIASVIVLLFQIPASIYIKSILKKAKKKRKEFENLTVIGIAGSYGKTAVKEFLYEILSAKFNVLKTKKHINAEIGIAQTILKELNFSHNILIVEIGAYEKGKIRQVCDIVKPKMGILTGINEQHLSTFGSQENINKAKNEILECSEIKIDYNNLDLIATNVVTEREFISFKINGTNFKVNLLGRHNIDNILLAVSCALKLGMTLEEIARACLRIKPEQGAMKLIRKDSLTILDASYSANFNGVIADLDYLNTYQGRKIIVMPCLIELGSASKEVHKKIGDKIDQVCDFAIITTKDYFKEIKQERKNIVLIEDPAKIVSFLKSVDQGTVLLEGRVPNKLKNEII